MRWIGAFCTCPARGVFSIGFRLADAEGPGRLDPSYYDLLASEARLASFIAIARGDVPQEHWFRLSRSLVSVEGHTTLVSWSGSMFEYLMPLLLLRSYPETLLENACRELVRAQIRYGRHQRRAVGHLGVRVSRDRMPTATTSTRPSGFRALGLKRGLAEDLVVAPYATALAAMVEPAAAAANLRRLAREGAVGPYGFYEAIDYTPRRALDPDADGSSTRRTQRRARMVRTPPGHEPRGTRQRVLGAPHGAALPRDPRVQATDLLLQERVPRYGPITRPRPAESRRIEPASPAVSPRRFRSPHTRVPDAQFLSNGAVHDGGHQRRRRSQQLARPRGDARARRRHLRSRQPVRLSARRAQRRALVGRPPAGVPRARATTGDIPRRRRRCSSARDDGIETRLEIAVSPEDDVEVRRVTLINRSERPARDRGDELVEIVLAPPADDLAHPAFVKLFLESEYLPECTALLCGRRPRSPDEATPWAVHVLSARGAAYTAPVEWETDRARFLGRGRTAENPHGARWARAVGHHRAPCSIRSLSLRRRVRIGPAARVRLAFATGVADSRARRPSRWQRSTTTRRPPSRTFALASTQTEMRLRHLGISGDEAQLFERLASHVLWADGSLRRPPQTCARNTLGQAGTVAAWRFRAICRSWWCACSRRRPGSRAPGAARAGVLAPQGTAADVVILNEHPVELHGRDARATQALLEQGPWARLEAPPRRRVSASRRRHSRKPSARCCWPRPAPC